MRTRRSSTCGRQGHPRGSAAAMSVRAHRRELAKAMYGIRHAAQSCDRQRSRWKPGRTLGVRSSTWHDGAAALVRGDDLLVDPRSDIVQLKAALARRWQMEGVIVGPRMDDATEFFVLNDVVRWRDLVLHGSQILEIPRPGVVRQGCLPGQGPRRFRRNATGWSRGRMPKPAEHRPD